MQGREIAHMRQYNGFKGVVGDRREHLRSGMLLDVTDTCHANVGAHGSFNAPQVPHELRR